MGNQKNKLYSNQKSNYVAIFYPKVVSIRGGEDYATYYKYALIKFKPWLGDKINAYGGVESTDSSIIKLWEDFVENIVASGERSPDYL